MSKPHELGQFGNVVSVSDSDFTTVSISGIVSATSFVGDGVNLTNTGAVLSAATGTQRIPLTSLTSGVMTTASTDAALTFDASTGTLSATNFSGDGSNLTNTGAVLSAATGTQRIPLTNITSGIMTAASTDATLTFDASTGTLSATKFSGDGSGITNAGATLSPASSLQRLVLTSLTTGAMTATATDSNLTYDANTSTLSTVNISASSFSGDGSNLTNTGAQLGSSSGEQRLVLTSLTSGVMTDAATTSNLTYNTVTNKISSPSEYLTSWVLGADIGNTYYTFTGDGYVGTEQNPDLYLVRGQTYRITNTMQLHPFQVQSTPGASGTIYNDGLSTNTIDNDTIEWTVRMDAPSILYYQCTSHTAMQGKIYINNASDPYTTKLSYVFPTTGLLIPNVLETTSVNAIKSNASLTLQSSSGFKTRQIIMKSHYASSFGGQSTNEGAIVFKLLGADNIVMGGYNAGGSITNDTYWGGRGNLIMGPPGGSSRTTDAGSFMAISNNDCTYIGAGAGAGSNYDYNTAIGSGSGIAQNTGSQGNCTAIGYNACWSSAGTNEVTLGDSNITTLRCNTQTISALSDRRDKTNIEDVPVGLDYINALRPVKFDWKRRDGSFKGQKAFGFIAQELDEVQDKFGYREYTRLTFLADTDKIEATPLNTYPILVKAVQELSQQNQEMLRRIEDLDNRLNGG